MTPYFWSEIKTLMFIDITMPLGGHAAVDYSPVELLDNPRRSYIYLSRAPARLDYKYCTNIYFLIGLPDACQSRTHPASS